MDLEEIVRKSISIEEVNESQDKYFEFVLMNTFTMLMGSDGFKIYDSGEEPSYYTTTHRLHRDLVLNILEK